MNNKLYSNILNSISKEVKTIISEQFNMNDLDFSDNETENNVNIFNKTPIDFEYFYDKLLNDNITKKEIKLFNNAVSVIKIRNKAEL